MSKVTLHSMLTEMETWCSFTEEQKAKAKSSDVHTSNNPKLRRLVDMWQDGEYDEDPEVLAQELVELIPE